MLSTAMMRERRFGEAGARVVIEQCLTGPESVVLRAERRRARVASRDPRRITNGRFDDDEGPNTGGMGAFAPSPLLDAALEARIVREVVEPVIAGMRAEGHPTAAFCIAG